MVDYEVPRSMPNKYVPKFTESIIPNNIHDIHSTITVNVAVIVRKASWNMFQYIHWYN